MNELSPRRFPRSPAVAPKTPPQWKKPDEVMKQRRIRLKQRVLTARMTDISQRRPQSSPTSEPSKRKNPFRKNVDTNQELKKLKEEEPPKKELADIEGEVFSLLGITNEPSSVESLVNQFIQRSQQSINDKVVPEFEGVGTLSVDWTLRIKMRFLSLKSFPLSMTLKTCQEASGITGFVRCIDMGAEASIGLDTSLSAQFHQSCLYWQHPSLPWLQLFPRNPKHNPMKLSSFALQPHIKETLHHEWSESFRSLFQLVRARHCPYFYLVANTYTCLFRAGGINGQSEMSALLYPTTMGLRSLLTKEGIQYKMPLRKNQRRSTDCGMNISSTEEKTGMEEDDDDDDNEDDEEEERDTSEWLATLGVEEDEIKRISRSEEVATMAIDMRSDGGEDSIVFIEGSGTQAFYNFLINSRTLSASSGILAGIPPTLFSPVAFTGGTLSALKVRENPVRLGSESYHSIEVNGPILPHIVHSLCNILLKTNEEFTVTCASVDNTKPFSKCATPSVTDVLNTSSKSQSEDNLSPTKTKEQAQGEAFSVQNLSDCGLRQEVLYRFCSDDVGLYDSIKVSHGLYSCK